jgi:hypothetical protein
LDGADRGVESEAEQQPDADRDDHRPRRVEDGQDPGDQDERDGHQCE